MSINNTISSLGLEIDKLIQKVNKLKKDNQYLVDKNKELAEQINNSSSERGDTGDKLAHYLERLKTVNQADAEPENLNSQHNNESLDENLQGINPQKDYL